VPKPGEVMDHVWGSQLNDKKELARKWKGTTSDPNTDFPSAEEGDVCLDYVKKGFYEFTNNFWKRQGIPPGLIGLWDQETIPDGWLKCDGNNGTPNIQGRFVRGASSSTGTTGGSASVSHSHTATGSDVWYGTLVKVWEGGSPLDYVKYFRHYHPVTSTAVTIDLLPSYIALHFIMKG